MSPVSFSEFLGTAILVLVLLAVLDSRNGAPPSWSCPSRTFRNVSRNNRFPGHGDV